MQITRNNPHTLTTRPPRLLHFEVIQSLNRRYRTAEYIPTLSRPMTHYFYADTDIMDSLPSGTPFCVSTTGIERDIVEAPASVTFDDVGGMDSVKQELKAFVQNCFKHEDQSNIDDKGSPLSKAALLYGPSGIGKTLVVNALANELQVNLLDTSFPSLLVMGDRHLPSNLRRVANHARAAAPCILFIDELSSMIYADDPRRDNRRTVENEVQSDLTRALRQFLDDLHLVNAEGNDKGVAVICATHSPHTLSPTLFEPGRLDTCIYAQLPDEASRLSILSVCTKRHRLSADVDLPLLARRIEGYSGSDLSEMCERSAKSALREAFDKVPTVVTRAHFEEAMRFARRSVCDDEVQIHERFSQYLQSLGTVPTGVPEGLVDRTRLPIGFVGDVDDDLYA